MPPIGAACAAMLVINNPQKGVAAEIPRFAAVKYKPLANSGAEGAAEVTQYCMVFATIPAEIPQIKMIIKVGITAIPPTSKSKT